MKLLKGWEMIIMSKYKNTSEKIHDFINLPEGWSFREGIPPTENVVKKALLLNSAMDAAKFSSTDAFPGVGGQIQVNAYADDVYLEFIVENEQEIFFTLELQNEIVFEVVPTDIFQAVSTIFFWGKKVWDTSGLSTNVTSIRKKEDLQELLSVDYKKESPLLIQNVSKIPAQISANILKDGTRTFLERRRFTLGYQTNSYQTIPT